MSGSAGPHETVPVGRMKVAQGALRILLKEKGHRASGQVPLPRGGFPRGAGGFGWP